MKMIKLYPTNQIQCPMRTVKAAVAEERIRNELE